MDWVMDHLRSAGPADYWENKDIYLPLLFGQPIDPAQLKKLPDPLIIGGPRKGDMLHIFGGSHLSTPWFVSEEVKIVIERLEPKVHTFIEVNLVFKDIPQPGMQFFMLHVSRVIDAVVIEETEFNSGYGKVGFDKTPSVKRLHNACTLDSGMVVGNQSVARGNYQVWGG